LVALTRACLNDAAQPGDPAAGPMTRAGLSPGDFFYVDGTPVMALAYGLDVAAQQRWGRAPDLVLSGPNEGQNLGAVVISSGTVSIAQFAALRGLPAIALSAGENSASATLDNPLSPEIARLSVMLVEALESRAGAGPLLPGGLALNVNFPDDPARAGWRATRIGNYNAYRIGFTDNMAQSATAETHERARARGIELPQLPGLTFAANDAEPLPAQADDESVAIRSAITVSPMQAGYAYGAEGEGLVGWLLGAMAGE
jgi:5'-nucleotidase